MPFSWEHSLNQLRDVVSIFDHVRGDERRNSRDSDSNWIQKSARDAKGESERCYDERELADLRQTHSSLNGVLERMAREEATEEGACDFPENDHR
jgi:hypothetical protein